MGRLISRLMRMRALQREPGSRTTMDGGTLPFAPESAELYQTGTEIEPGPHAEAIRFALAELRLAERRRVF